MLNYTWNRASGQDIQNIVNLAEQHFSADIDKIFQPNPITYSRHITHAVVNQYYNPNKELLLVTYADDKLLAYTWAQADHRCNWSDDAMVNVNMASVDMQLNARQRVMLVKDMMKLWEYFAEMAGNDIVCSTTVRYEQDGFLKLHARMGYDIRGSVAYKKLATTKATPAN
jgi:hypothetical protein